MLYFTDIWKGRLLKGSQHETEKTTLLGSTDCKPYRSSKNKCSEGCKRKIGSLPNCILRSFIGFVGGVLLTYLCFIFFVYQLSIPLVHATIMSSIIGILLTLGLAFSNTVRCLVLLLIPQLFSRIGRYTLTCYALILILTGPATNTLRNSEVLTESMACSQEQIKANVRHLSDSMKQPFNAMKDSVHTMLDKLDQVNRKLKDIVKKIELLVISIADVIQFSYDWIKYVVRKCNHNLGTPYEHCMNVIRSGIPTCKSTLGVKLNWLCNITRAEPACKTVKNYKQICVVDEFAQGSFAATIKRKLRIFTTRMKKMFYVNIQMHYKYTVCNASRSASQVAAGIVTEIRNKADPLITWLSWSSCVTSLFLMVIIFRAKYYQNMYETRSRFDNRYITNELYEIDFKRMQEGRETILPLNRRERAKYIPTTSFKLIATEKVFMSRSAVFMAITTFKLMIHIIADYSLFWVLTTIRNHGKLQNLIPPGPSDAGIKISGTGFGADLLKQIFKTLTLPLHVSSTPSNCLPNPHPPDFKRYSQIGILIMLLWLLALFEPYGLRLRHVIMGHHKPERAKARASWLYNHILRTRGSFMKLARRKLHREYKYYGQAHLTFRHWLDSHIPCWCIRYLLGTLPREPHCLLCETTEKNKDFDTHLTRCETPSCPGIYCTSCFTDIGQLCTICLSPADYGDYSDISLEKGSSDEDSDDVSIDYKEKANKGYVKLQMSVAKVGQGRSQKYYDIIYRASKSVEKNLKNTLYEGENVPLLKFEQIKNNDIEEEKFNNKELHDDLQSKLLDVKKHTIEGDTLKYFPKYSSFILKNNIQTFLLNLKRRRQKFHVLRRQPSYRKRHYSITKIFKSLSLHFCKYRVYRCMVGRIFKKSNKCPTNADANKSRTYMKIINCKKCVTKQRLKKFRRQQNQELLFNRIIQLGQKQSIPSKVTIQDSGDATKNNKNKKKKQKQTKDLRQSLAKSETKIRSNYAKTVCMALTSCVNDTHGKDDLKIFENNCIKSTNKKHKKNFKRRKKQKPIVESDKNFREQIESSRDYRISAYLQDQSWIKGIIPQESMTERRDRECALKELAQCRLYAVSNKAREMQLLKVLKKRLSTHLCACHKTARKHVTLNPEVAEGPDLHLPECVPDIPRPTPRNCPGFPTKKTSVIKPKPKLSCECRKVSGNQDQNEQLNKLAKKIMKWCRGSKYSCKIHDVRREEISASYKGSDLINLHEFEKEQDELPEAERSQRRLDFYQSIGNEFDLTRGCVSSDNRISNKNKKSSTNIILKGEENFKDSDKMSSKTFRLQDLKLVLSERFWHLRIKNPAPVLKDLCTYITQFSEKKSNGVKNDTRTGFKETVDRTATALPLSTSRSCQCYVNTLVQDRGTQMRKTDEDHMISVPKHLEYTTKKELSLEKHRNRQYPVESSSDFDLCNALRSSTIPSEESKTDTTICSRVEVDYVEERPRKATVKRVKKVKVNVTTKTNQATITENTQLCDVSTLTDDWWSPIVEKKKLKHRYENGDHKMNRTRKNKGVCTDKRMVKFLSRAQIIPRADTYDILSPSRYLLESQKYYNELFSSRLFSPRLFPAVMTKVKAKESECFHSKRNIRHKSKRLEECTRFKRNKNIVERSQSDENSRNSARKETKLKKHGKKQG